MTRNDFMSVLLFIFLDMLAINAFHLYYLMTSVWALFKRCKFQIVFEVLDLRSL